MGDTEELGTPQLEHEASGKYSVTLGWSLPGAEEIPGLVWRLQLRQEKPREWITKYWGPARKTEVKGLGPENIYTFRVGVARSAAPEDLEVWSEPFTTATKEDFLRVFYLFRGLERNDLQAVRSVIAEREEGDWWTAAGEWALGLAAGRGREAALRALLGAGAALEGASLSTGRTALMEAARAGQTTILNLLLEKGARPDTGDRNGCTALHLAVDGASTEVAKALVSKGADVEAKDSGGWTPLARALVLSAPPPFVDCLLGLGANPSSLPASVLPLWAEYQNQNPPRVSDDETVAAP